MKPFSDCEGRRGYLTAAVYRVSETVTAGMVTETAAEYGVTAAVTADGVTGAVVNGTVTVARCTGINETALGGHLRQLVRATEAVTV